MIKTLDTFYNGYHFRSRLEARWALVFDELGIEYLYEPKAFQLSNGDKYLPDFFLPKYGYWVEVKGTFLKGRDFNKAVYLVRDSEEPLLILHGDPDYKYYCLMTPDGDGQYSTENINIILDENDKFISDKYVNGEKSYIKEGESGKRSVAAIKKARAERFGIYESKHKELLF